ncbi:MAG: YveK family protein [Eubacteriales bacterium]|jgi:capsular polysaccharide biosynthesis protein
MEHNETQNSLSLADLWSIFASHWIIIITAALLVFAAVTAYTVLTYQPEYTSTATVYILRRDSEGNGSSINSADFSLALSTVNDCREMLTSHRVLDEVIERLGMPIKYEELKNMISVKNPTSTRFLEITVRAPSPSDAKIIVDELCKIGTEVIMEVLGIDQVNLVDDGTYSEVPVNSRVTPYSFVAALVAAVMVYGIYVMLFVLDDKIKSPDDVEKYLGLTVLALIPNANGEDDTRGNKYGRYKYYKYQKYSQYR